MARRNQREQEVDKGAMHFAAKKDLFEIQRGNNFEFVLPDADFKTLTPYGANKTGKKLNDANEMIRLSVSSASIPYYSQQAIEVRRGNTVVKYAGPISYGSGSIKCYDFIGAQTKDILMAWQALAGDPLTQKVGQQKAYKRNCNLIEYTPDYTEIVRTWMIEGCWISDMSDDGYSVDSGGSAKQISVTIQFDRAYPIYD
jgi:hypothetical protein